jgi:hypothetical protein
VRTTDPVGTALASIAAGATTGAAAIALGTLMVRMTQQAGASDAPETAAAVLSASLIIGITLAAGTGWMLTAAVEDLWRRGVTAAVSVLGASLLAVVTLPLDALVGQPALLVYASLLAVGAVIATRAARRNAAK